MKTHEFYQKYANTNIADRFRVVDIIHHDLETLKEIYEQIKELDDEIAEREIKQNKLLERAKVAFENLASETNK